MDEATSTFGTLLSIQVGKPCTYGAEEAIDPHDRLWTSGFFKTTAEGPVFASRTNLSGDGQADRINHGGIDKAVLAYSADHYPKWREELALPEMPHGGFGENLTISGLSEQSVCIGDILRISAVTFEVSQPRKPCWKLARRWRLHALTGMVVQNGWSGWYLRVLQEGWLEAPAPVELIQRPNPEWPIARAHQILHHCQADLKLTLELADVPGLAGAWVQALRERAAVLASASETLR